MNNTAMRISTEKSELDIALIHRFLCTESAWAEGISRPTVELAIANSLCFGGYVSGSQVAFARVISDCATFANLVDVFVIQGQRGCGYGRAIVQSVMSHPQLQNLRRFTLATKDAYGLYAQFGFAAPQRPQTLMERYDPAIYQRVERVTA